MQNRTTIKMITMFTVFFGITFIISGQGLKGNKDKQDNGKSKSQSETFSSDYNWGVGIRLGDPSGFTLKKYINNNALELNVGRAHTIGNQGYWNTRYKDKWNDKYYNTSYKKIDYLGYTTSSPIGFQLHYLWQKNISNLEGFSWYYGFGGQFAFQSVRYEYRYKIKGNDNWIYDYDGTLLDIDFGADGVIGMEYAFSKIPISLFLDLNLFMEVYDSPFVFWFQSGTGARYNF